MPAAAVLLLVAIVPLPQEFVVGFPVILREPIPLPLLKLSFQFLFVAVRLFGFLARLFLILLALLLVLFVNFLFRECVALFVGLQTLVRILHILELGFVPRRRVRVVLLRQLKVQLLQCILIVGRDLLACRSHFFEDLLCLVKGNDMTQLKRQETSLASAELQWF